MESKEKLQKHLDSLENEFFKAKKRMEIFDDAASHAWENISDEIKSSFKTMKDTYNKTKDYYK